ncbi:uncharacterized protein BBA_09069 [Beauveria bassiana ARSEF 2860]|uniref:Uncharacterized protein n=1 Tax=Beauveria bassiana (strain ARSEF 2860) TaxID=655819 RepID=J5JE56_BEAB2|nr:uncharacterized protein BBA_09069 [Beauveria bassiana ARSEF 2860]EJP62021.1 hypothetical protein BBA_09069 [Beauveria bassiana ARSEF 2860]
MDTTFQVPPPDRDKKHMFLNKLHGPMSRPHLRLTSIFIQRSTFFALFGKDLGISVAGVESTEDTHMFDHSSSHEQRLPMFSQAQMPQQALNVAERRTSARRSMEEQEARLAQLAATERQLSRHVEQLKSDTALQERRIQTLKSEEQEALQRLNGLQQTETEQTIRLEALKADEQNRQSEIVVLEQRRDNLGDQIRLDLLGPGEKERPATVERDGAFPDHHASSRPEQVSRVEDLAAKVERLRAVVKQLTLQMAHLDEEKASKVASMAAVEENHRSAINQLVAEEVALRNQIDQLKTYLARLEARLGESAGRTTELEEKRGASVERRATFPTSSVGLLPTRDCYQRRFGDNRSTWRHSWAANERCRFGTRGERSTQLGQNASYLSAPHDDLYPVVEMHEAMEYSSQISSQGAEKVCIEFKLLIDGEWKTQTSVVVDPAEPSAVQRQAAKYMRNGMGIFDSENQMLRPQNCFGRVTGDGTRTIYLLPEWSAIEQREAAWRPRKRNRTH